MKTYKKIIILAVSIAAIVGIIFSVYVMNTSSLSKEADYINVLSAPIAIGKSGLTLSNVGVNNSEYRLLFTAKELPQSTNLNPEGNGPAIYSPDAEISYENNGSENKLNPDGHAFTKNLDTYNFSYYYKGIPKNSKWIKVTITFPDNQGKVESFTTPPIELKAEK